LHNLRQKEVLVVHHQKEVLRALHHHQRDLHCQVESAPHQKEVDLHLVEVVLKEVDLHQKEVGPKAVDPHPNRTKTKPPVKKKQFEQQNHKNIVNEKLD
jgi:hypothetical protein